MQSENTASLVQPNTATRSRSRRARTRSHSIAASRSTGRSPPAAQSEFAGEIGADIVEIDEIAAPANTRRPASASAPRQSAVTWNPSATASRMKEEK
jgi:hypothetical protein